MKCIDIEQADLRSRLMHLEVFCEDRMGLTRELLELLASYHIDLRGIEIDSFGRIYLNFKELDFNVFCQLMAEIRRINGVRDVRTVPYMPSAQKQGAIWALLASLSDPVFTVDMKGKVELANQATLTLFGMTKERIYHQNAGTLIGNHEGLRWLEHDTAAPHTKKIVIRGQDYLREIIPICSGDGTKKNSIGSIVILKSVACLGR